MTPRKLALALVASAAILSACGDSQLLRASLPTVQDGYVVFALTGTPAAYPSGLNTYVRSTVRVDGNANFDVAFDIDTNGKVVLYPVQKIVTSLSGTRRVGLRKIAAPFDSITIAPSGTLSDSSIVASKGETVIVQAARNGNGDACQFDLSPYIYTKLHMDSIAVDSRTVFLTAILNPNCGFRSFEPGIPAK